MQPVVGRFCGSSSSSSSRSRRLRRDPDIWLQPVVGRVWAVNCPVTDPYNLCWLYCTLYVICYILHVILTMMYVILYKLMLYYTLSVLYNSLQYSKEQYTVDTVDRPQRRETSFHCCRLTRPGYGWHCSAAENFLHSTPQGNGTMQCYQLSRQVEHWYNTMLQVEYWYSAMLPIVWTSRVLVQCNTTKCLDK